MMHFLRLVCVMLAVLGCLSPQLAAEMERHSELAALIYAPEHNVSDETKILQILGTKKLILSKLNISEVPGSICELTQLEVIDLQSNSISSLPEGFSRLKNLKTLNLSNNLFTSLPSCIFELASLTGLKITNNQLSDLSAYNKVSMLDVLISQRSGIALGSSKFSHLTSLRELDLSGNHIRRIPAEIFSLPGIQKINLAKNMISQLSDNLDISSSLEYVDLGSNQLSSLVLSSPASSNLKELDLSDNFFRQIPDSLLGCGSLNKLNAEKNAISVLDASIRKLKRLVHLNLGDNLLSRLPEEIEFPESLQYLNLSNNHLESLPDSMLKTASLEYLSVRANRLDAISDRLSELSNLKVLDISDNHDGDRVTLALPEALFKLEKLVDLRMSHASLSEMEDSECRMFEGLRNLVALDLSFTHLTYVPSFVFKLKALVTLKIRGNNLTSIDDGISDLSALENLDISECMLTSINNKVCALQNLKYLAIGKNPLSSLPPGLNALSSLTKLDVSGSLETVTAFKDVELFPASLEILCMKNCPAQLLELRLLNKCPNITRLDISCCGLKNIDFLAHSLPSLECLDISGNQVVNFDVLLSLKKLAHLNLRSNGIERVPLEITKLSSLRTLDLSCNKIALLQDAIGDMANLTVLNLGENMIESVCFEMGSMKNLEVLVLRSRLVGSCKVHESIAQIKGLRILDLPSIACFDLIAGIEERESLRSTYLKNLHSGKCLEHSHGYSDASNLLQNPEESCFGGSCFKRFFNEQAHSSK